MSAPGLQEWFEQEVAEGIFGRGGQLYVSITGETIVDAAVGHDGVGRPVQRDTLFSLYCAAKPLVSAAIGTLVDDGEASWDDCLGDIIPGAMPAHLARLRLHELLSHRAGLHALRQRIYVLTPERFRDGLIAATKPDQGWGRGTSLAYCEVASWHLAARAIENLSGVSPEEYVNDRICSQSGIASELFAGMSAMAFDQHRDRLGVNAWITPSGSDPALLELSPRLRSTSNVAVSGSGSARGLGRFYEALLSSAPPGGLLESHTYENIVARHATGWDLTFERRCSYGLGVMVDLPNHHFGSRVSPSAFGHSGNGGTTVGFCDPAYGLVVAYHMTCRSDGESSVILHRPMMVGNIYTRLGLA